jgi:hypothetical protein
MKDGAPYSRPRIRFRSAFPQSGNKCIFAVLSLFSGKIVDQATLLTTRQQLR